MDCTPTAQLCPGLTRMGSMATCSKHVFLLLFLFFKLTGESGRGLSRNFC